MTTQRPRQYWAFCANPRFYRIMDAIRECRFDSWNIPRGDVRAGDRALIWKAKGPEEHRGIVALADILSDPAPGMDPNRAYWRDPFAPDDPMPRVTVRYLVPPSLPLWEEADRAPAILKQLSVSRATGGSVFVVTPEQWEAVLDAVGGWPDVEAEISAIEDAIVERAGQRRGGQGFRASAALRRAIERHAMEMATAHYEGQGWQVSDVSATQPYDLYCLRGTGEQLRVEVKGTTSAAGGQVLLTRGEVEHARTQYPHLALFIVASIAVTGADESGYTASGGIVGIYEPWCIDEGELAPLAYAYTPPAR